MAEVQMDQAIVDDPYKAVSDGFVIIYDRLGMKGVETALQFLMDAFYEEDGKNV